MSQQMFRRQVQLAVTWRIVAEVFRRYGMKYGLRVVELHPGGGQYDCISVRASKNGDPFGRSVCDFHVPAQHVHFFEPVDGPKLSGNGLRWPEPGDYVLAFLEAEDPKRIVDQISEMMGLYSKPKDGMLPPTLPPVLAVRAIAGLLERYSLSRLRLDTRCGWHDSSGCEGCYVQPWVERVPSVWKHIQACEDPVRRSARLWEVRRVDRSSGVIMDFATCTAYGPLGETKNMWELYTNHNRKIGPVIDWLEEHTVA